MEYAALALLRALPDYFLDRGEVKGRQATILERMRKAVDMILIEYPYYNDAMRDDIGSRIERFNKAAFGKKNSKHIITMICFSLLLAEGMANHCPWPVGGRYTMIRVVRDRAVRRILQELNSLFAHYENANKNSGILPLCIDGGRRMAEKWQNLTL